MKIKFYIFFLFTFLHHAGAQHSPLYSFYMYNGFVLNPALAGKSNALNVVLHYRNQWTQINGHPVTYTTSFDTPIKTSRFNIGGIFAVDKYGPTIRTDYTQCMAYRVALNDIYQLSIGASLGVYSRRFDYSILDAPSEDPAYHNNGLNSIAPTIGGGIYLNSPKAFIGLSKPSIRWTKTSKYEIAYQPVYLISGFNYQISPTIAVMPSVLCKYINTSPLQIDLNAMFDFKDTFSAGLSYRIKDAVAFLTEINLKQLKVGYAYDYDVNKLRKVSQGSHEIVIKYQFRYIVKVMDPRTFN